ncbi:MULTISPECIES: sulfatase [unclassified Crossiella]|uniref:sulfatase n=1 Tax=unclassified Crossiella TaxID=2620835 RepID=UPI00200024C5|nr:MULTISPECIES: sulfatase [unclassified Crossiella]MCK2243467.1 sulfatase [Crossiella sp. S99.2]MCK2257325.1 sulfatase [Crossiella sp. S99.1]
MPARSTVDGRGTGRRVLAHLVTALAALLVLFGLVLPNDVDRLTPAAFLRLPAEGLLVLLLLLFLPGKARRVTALLGGVALGLLTVVKFLDLGFDAVLYRPFDLLLDWPLFGPAVDYLEVTLGHPATLAAIALAGLLVLAALFLTARATLRLTEALARRRRPAIQAVAVLAVLAVTATLPVATATTGAVVYEHARRVQAGLHDQDAFAAAAAVDPFRDTPGPELLTALRGKDVVLAFVESYGRDALDQAGVGAVLDNGTRELGAAGFAARSGFLTSPTAGGGSWLAQATLLSGLWIDNEQRYRTLVASERLTLNGAFRRASWSSVGVVPGITRAWPEGAFFDYQRIHAAADLGYRGPRFGYATTPDQFTLAAFQRAERAPANRPPVMATIPLVTSHAPWTPTPELLDWNGLGDGSVYTAPPGAQDRSPAQVRADYGHAIEYSLRSLISYLRTHGDPNLVLVFLGDHQPAQLLTGANNTRDVPITIVAKDPAVFERTAGWGWTEGLKPAPGAPVWPMDAFRDRFLTAFGPTADVRR